MIHLNADVIQHVDNVLIISFSVSFFLLQHVRNCVELFRIVLCFIECLKLLQSITHLYYDLTPLELVVLKVCLDLLDQSVLVFVELLFLNAESPFNILEKMLCRKHLPFTLTLSVLNDGLDILLLKFKLLLHLAEHRVYTIY